MTEHRGPQRKRRLGEEEKEEEEKEEEEEVKCSVAGGSKDHGETSESKKGLPGQGWKEGRDIVKKYKKRKGRLSMQRKVKSVPDGIQEKRPYVKRKGRFSHMKKSNQTKSKQSDCGFKDTCVQTERCVEGSYDGDDYLECYYQFVLIPSAYTNEPYSPPMDYSLLNCGSDTERINCITYDMHHYLLNTPWIVDSANNVCRISLLGSQPNATVEKSITWSCENKAQIFIHNEPLASESFVWGLKVEDPNYISDVTDYLLRLSTVLGSVSVCCGIQKFQELWREAEDNGFGNVETLFQENPCLRSANRSLAVSGSEICAHCHNLLVRLRHKKWRSQCRLMKNSKFINNRFLPKRILLAKTLQLNKEKVKLKRQLQYSRKKIRQFLRKESITVDNQLCVDFSRILRENVEHMTELQQLIWGEQLKALSKQRNPRAMRWNPMMIKMALHLYMISPAAYEYMTETGLVKLPSQRTLFDFTHFIEAKEGVQEEIINRVHMKLDKEKHEQNHEQYFNLLFDEMTIRSNLVMDKQGNLVGFTSQSDVEQSISNLESEVANAEPTEPKKKLAKKVLVYMLQGISINLQEVVGIFSTSELSAPQLYSKTWDVIYHLEARGIKIISLICDGASCNKKFFRMHTRWDDSVEFIYATRNIASGENRPIFFIVDPPHLLKTIRNCLSNSFAHKHSRTLWKNGEKLSWEPIEQLYEVTSTHKFKKHKLTKAHVKLTAFTKMNVRYATQVLSKSVADSLTDYKNDERFKGLVTSELIQLLNIMNNFFDSLNGSNDPDGRRNKKNDLLLPYTSINDKRLTALKEETLKYFQDWEKNVTEREGDYSKEDREKMMISSQSHESLYVTIYGFCGAVEFLLQHGVPSIDAKKFNQDKLEQYFGILRMSRGADNNIELKQVIQKSISYHVQQAAALPPKKGSTLGKRTLEVDEEPLTRKKKL